MEWYGRTTIWQTGDMPSSTRLADYRAALTAPGARWPVFTSLLGRLPIAMISLALLLYVHRQTGSFAAAGLASAGQLVGVATGSVVQGRLIDKLGPTRPLLSVIGVFAGFVAAVIISIEQGAPIAIVVALAFGSGATEPMIGSASRALWPRLLPAGTVRQAAYAYEAISMEVFFILGPGLAGVLTAVSWGGTGVIVGAACMIIGAAGFALTPEVRRWRPRREAESAGLGAPSPVGLLGAVASPGMRTVALAALGFGVVVGFVEVAAPAAAANAGHPTIGGLLLSVWSAGSVAAGVCYGLRPWPRPMHLRLPVLLAGFSGLVALLALPSTLGWLAATMLLVGTAITPQSTAHSAAIEQVTIEGTTAEAFGWVITAVTLGSAIGQSSSGQLVELAGPAAAFLTASAAGLALAGLLWLRRATVLAGVPNPTRRDVALAAHH